METDDMDPDGKLGALDEVITESLMTTGIILDD